MLEGKHGVDFIDAIAALEDANRLEEIGTRFTYDEERIQVIGAARDGVLFVIVTLPDEETEIIPCRNQQPPNTCEARFTALRP